MAFLGKIDILPYEIYCEMYVYLFPFGTVSLLSSIKDISSFSIHSEKVRTSIFQWSLSCPSKHFFFLLSTSLIPFLPLFLNFYIMFMICSIIQSTIFFFLSFYYTSFHQIAFFIQHLWNNIVYYNLLFFYITYTMCLERHFIQSKIYKSSFAVIWSDGIASLNFFNNTITKDSYLGVKKKLL